MAPRTLAGTARIVRMAGDDAVEQRRHAAIRLDMEIRHHRERPRGRCRGGRGGRGARDLPRLDGSCVWLVTRARSGDDHRDDGEHAPAAKAHRRPGACALAAGILGGRGGPCARVLMLRSRASRVPCPRARSPCAIARRSEARRVHRVRPWRTHGNSADRWSSAYELLGQQPACRRPSPHWPPATHSESSSSGSRPRRAGSR